jgi:RNA polymerase subunit RPABC4/transcription elongation factor Spt4
MALKICRECGTEISKDAKMCPKCGKDQRNFFVKHRGITAIIAIIIICVAVAASNGTNNNTISTSTNNITIQKQEKATLEKFNKIETGMSYQEVVDIMGEEGILSTESSYGSQTMKVYYWYASDGISNATVSFMNNEVSGKSQIGLK